MPTIERQNHSLLHQIVEENISGISIARYIDVPPLEKVLQNEYTSNSLLYNIREDLHSYSRWDLGDVYALTLFALAHTERWHHDPIIDQLQKRRKNPFRENNLEHDGGIIQEANALFQAIPSIEQPLVGKRARDKQDFVEAILMHDLQEAVIGDRPAHGLARENEIGKRVKRAELTVFNSMVGYWIKDKSYQKHLIDLQQEMHEKKTPRARLLRFLDKIQGTDTAFKEFYSLLTAQERTQEPFFSHINASLNLIFTAAKDLQEVLDEENQEVFANYFHGTILEKIRNLGFEEHVKLNDELHNYPLLPQTIVSFS